MLEIVARGQDRPERSEGPQCEFVHTSTAKQCKNAAKWVARAEGVVERILVCGTHVKPFLGKIGMSASRLHPK